MTREEQIVLLCCRQDFENSTCEEVRRLCSDSAVNWNQIYTIAADHYVAPLIYTNLQRCQAANELALPVSIQQQFKSISMKSVITDRGRGEALGRAFGFFAEHAIDVMILKSAALAAQVYDHPWYTMPADVDLVLRLNRPTVTSEERQFILNLEHSAIECDLFAHHDITMNGTLAVDFDRIWRDACRVNYQDQPVYTMAAEDLLLSLCINSARKRYVHIKSMVDIRETLQRCAIDWAILVEKAHAYGIAAIAYAALWVTDRRLDCRLAPNVLNRFDISPVRAGLIRRVEKTIPLSGAIDLRSGAGITLLGRRVSPSIALRYLTLQTDQIGRHVRFVFRTPQAKFEFWDGQ